ncbi:hypothetical protein ACXJJ3_32815 [Kribbella sp. WER1]
MSESAATDSNTGNTPADTNVADGNDNARSLDNLPAEYAWVAKEIRDANNEAKNLRARAKAGDDAATRFAEIEAASKTDAEKAAERLNTAEKSVTDLTAENMRLRVAIEHGVPADLIDRLRGNDAEEMGADAKALMQRLTPQQSKPAPDPSQGAKGNQGTNPADLFGGLFT